MDDALHSKIHPVPVDLLDPEKFLFQVMPIVTVRIEAVGEICHNEQKKSAHIVRRLLGRSRDIPEQSAGPFTYLVGLIPGAEQPDDAGKVPATVPWPYLPKSSSTDRARRATSRMMSVPS